jgi:hypothetical protein
MNILDTHIYKLRFKLDFDAPNDYIEKWNKLKKECETTNNKIIVDEIKNYCKLESNKNLPYLKRCEGGLGGNDNIMNKQIRFRLDSIKYDDDILLYIENSEFEKWTYEELDDILRSFIIVLNKIMSCECVNGCIEIFNKDMYNDNYFDSDYEAN